MSAMTDVPKAYFTALFCEAIMHGQLQNSRYWESGQYSFDLVGIYTVVFAATMYLLLYAAIKIYYIMKE